MNKAVMVIWGLTVSMILGIILLIGYKQRDEIYLNLTSSLELATKKYILNNNSNIKFNERKLVFINELIENNYIKEEDIDNINKYCIKSIVYTKGLFEDNYTLNKECENKE